MRRSNRLLYLLAAVAASFLLAVIILSGYRRAVDDEALVVRPRCWPAEPTVVLGGDVWAPSFLYTVRAYPLGERLKPLQEIEARSRDGVDVTLSSILAYTIKPSAIGRVDERWGEDYEDRCVAPIARGALIKTVSSKTAESLLWSCGELSDECRAGIAKQLEPLGFSIVSFGVESCSLPDEVERLLIERRASMSPYRVMIIGIDGADWDIIDPMIESGKLPNIRRIKERGAWGLLESIQPLLSPLIWTTIATGKRPERHGILDFMVKDHRTGGTVPTTSNLRRVKAVWNILSDFKRKVGVVGWLCTWPAERVDGFIVSDRLGYHSFMMDRQDIKPDEDLVYPPSLYQEIRSYIVSPEQVTRRDLRRFIDVPDAEFRESFKSKYESGNPVNNLRLIFATSKTYRNIGRHLYERYRPDLFAIYFEAIDSASHIFMKYMQPKMDEVTEEDFRKYRGAVEAVYEYQDEVIGDFLKLPDKDTVVIILSDHGFRSGIKRPARAPEIGLGTAAAWHETYGALMMEGGPVKEGFEIGGASVLDITPTVLALMGFPVACDMGGKVLSDAIKPDFLERLPVAAITGYEEEDRAERAVEPVASSMDGALKERLMSLGYISPEGFGGLRNLAVSLAEKGEMEAAEEVFRRAVELEPDSAALHNNFGIALTKMGKLEEAIREYALAIRLDPGLAEAYVNRGLAFQRMGRYDSAIESFKMALDREPTLAIARSNMANIYLKRGDYQKAREEYLKALELDGALHEAWNNLGAIYIKEGEPEKAREAFERALGVKPDFQEARNNLAIVEDMIMEGGGR